MIDVTATEFEDIARECANHVPENQVSDRARDQIQGGQTTNLIARDDSRPAGFLIGYDEPDGIFYDYLFGVAPAMRRNGVASRLLEHAEDWGSVSGHVGIRVQSRNKYPDVLRLLISRGYKIVRLKDRGDVDASPIRFERVLSS